MQVLGGKAYRCLTVCKVCVHGSGGTDGRAPCFFSRAVGRTSSRATGPRPLRRVSSPPDVPSRPRARVRAQVVVRPPGNMKRYLACFQQTMDDGRVRERNQLPSEKLFAGEVAGKAVARCLMEELGDLVTDADVEVLEESLVEWVEIIESPSFPNLTTQYRLQQMAAIVRSLPSTTFISVEGTKRHSWE